jgi:hypothetical protein
MGEGRPGHRQLEPRRLAVRAVVVALVVALAACRAPAASIDFPVAPGTFDAEVAPPWRFAHLLTARPVTSRILHVEAALRLASHGELARRGDDPRLAALEGAALRSLELDLAYGLGAGLSFRSRLRWWSFEAGQGQLEGGPGGPGDLDLAVALTPDLGDRLAARVEGGMTLATGSDRRYRPALASAFRPYSVGDNEPFLGGSVRLRLSRTGAPVAIDLHGAAHYQWRAAPRSGEAFVPYPDRLPLVSLETGGQALDRLELSAALSFTHGSTVLVSALDWPLLRGAGSLLAGQEAPRVISQGVRTGIGGHLEAGMELAFTFASDAAPTAFDPIAAYPEWSLRVGVSFEMVPIDGDRDGDGIGDRADRCPTMPEDRDGYDDRDGCPDPDNDGDGIVDARDVCPNEPEDADGFEDLDGCPDPDNDEDGIDDARDDCPDAAEDVDGFEDDDGCPDPDNDEDGIADGVDACPDDAEDIDGDADDDGCPD